MSATFIAYSRYLVAKSSHERDFYSRIRDIQSRKVVVSVFREAPHLVLEMVTRPQSRLRSISQIQLFQNV